MIGGGDSGGGEEDGDEEGEGWLMYRGGAGHSYSGTPGRKRSRS